MDSRISVLMGMRSRFLAFWARPRFQEFPRHEPISESPSGCLKYTVPGPAVRAGVKIHYRKFRVESAGARFDILRAGLLGAVTFMDICFTTNMFKHDAAVL